MSEGKHLTDKLADAIDDTAGDVAAADVADVHVPGPSPNPVTNLLINEIVLRSIGRITRHTLEKALLGKRYGAELARETIDNRSTMHTLTAYAVTKFATRSIPGFALVSTGLIAKTLFDRSQKRRKAQRKSDPALPKSTDPDQPA